MIMKIYVVVGQTGDYSDNIQWLVRAYETEKEAQDFCLMAIKWAEKYHEKYKGERIYDEHELPDFDPGFKTDYTGTTYDYKPVELYL